MILLALTACSSLFPASDGPDRDDNDDDSEEEGLETCPVEGCGGDLEGEWVIRDVCAPEAPTALEDESCPGATFTWRAFDLEGSFLFAEDGTYSVELGEGGFEADLYWPAGCDADEGDQEGCLAASDEDTTCAWSTTGCDCRWTWSDSEIGSQDGAWSTYGDDLYLDDGDGLAYCIDSDGLFFDLYFSGLPPVRLMLTPR